MRRILGVVTVLVLTGLVLLTVSRFVHTSLRWPILLASFSAYSLLGFLVVLLVGGCLLVRGHDRRWMVPVVVVAALGLVVQAWAQAPLFAGASSGGSSGRPAGGPADGQGLTVMTSNLEFGKGDAEAVVRTVAAEKVDVLVLEEVTPIAYGTLLAVGLAELLPHQVGKPVVTAAGTMVFSRYALESPRLFRLGNGGLDVRVVAPQPFRLLAVHAAQPVGWPKPWFADLEAVHERARETVEEGPTLVVGDFNATRDHQSLRAVLRTGLRDAAEQAGSGWQPTWPTRFRTSWLQPLIAIDHVLATDHYVATRTRTFEVRNTDHLALVADLRLTRISARR
ncbi:MAG: endonuclease/exonuclease/phosphatase family protein [Marmoricola sp.]